MVVDYIDDRKDRFGVDPICRVLSQYDVQIAGACLLGRHEQRALSAAQLRDAYDAHAVYQALERNHRLYGVGKARCGTRFGVIATKWAAIGSAD